MLYLCVVCVCVCVSIALQVSNEVPKDTAALNQMVLDLQGENELLDRMADLVQQETDLIIRLLELAKSDENGPVHEVSLRRRTWQ